MNRWFPKNIQRKKNIFKKYLVPHYIYIYLYKYTENTNSQVSLTFLCDIHADDQLEYTDLDVQDGSPAFVDELTS
jgi:hypothetical protein